MTLPAFTNRGQLNAMLWGFVRNPSLAIGTDLQGALHGGTFDASGAPLSFNYGNGLMIAAKEITGTDFHNRFHQANAALREIFGPARKAPTERVKRNSR